MKQIIFRVDDRLIHGQVVEGWIKNQNIPLVIIADDKIFQDSMQQFIYQSVVPPGTKVIFLNIDQLISEWEFINQSEKSILVLFSNVSDLYKSESLLDKSIFINLGCISSRPHCIAMSDTVFLEKDEVKMLDVLSIKWRINIQKVPWEKNIFFTRV